MLGATSFAHGLYSANFDYGVGPLRGDHASNGNLVPQMFGEALRWESFRLEVRDQIASLIVNQYVPSLLLVNATGHRRLAGRRLFGSVLLRSGKSEGRHPQHC